MFILIAESSIPPTCLSRILLRMIGSTVRYFILRCVSLWSAYCVLNSVSELLGETLRKRWLHEEKNMIARTLLIFMLFEAIFISVFVCSWWKKMKRPADLMNSAARITTASPTTGGATARMTVETTQTRRTAVSIWLLRFAVSPVCSFICAVNALHKPRRWKNWTPGCPSHRYIPPPFLPPLLTNSCICAPCVMLPTIQSAGFSSLFKASSYYLCCFSETTELLISSSLCNPPSPCSLLFGYSSSLFSKKTFICPWNDTDNPPC